MTDKSHVDGDVGLGQEVREVPPPQEVGFLKVVPPYLLGHSGLPLLSPLALGKHHHPSPQ